MIKVAEMEYPIHVMLSTRWSPRAFAPKPVEPQILRSLWEAVRWAPSSFNEQPWHFIVGLKNSGTTYERLLNCLVEGNMVWAKSAPVLAVAVTKLHLDHNGKENGYAQHDIGLALGNLLAQATAAGLYVHPMGGFSKDKVQEEFNVPVGFRPVTALAIGYLGDPDSLPDDLKRKEISPRTRKKQEEFVFVNTWGESFSTVEG